MGKTSGLVGKQGNRDFVTVSLLGCYVLQELVGASALIVSLSYAHRHK